MTLFQRFKHGAALIPESIRLLINNKMLCAYTFITALLQVLIQALYAIKIVPHNPHNAFTQFLQMPEGTLFSTANITIIVVTSALWFFVGTYIDSAIIYHVTSIIRTQHASIEKTLNVFYTKLPTLTLWALVSYLPFMVTTNTLPIDSALITFMIVLAGWVWLFAFALVMPFIMLNDISLLSAMRMSFAIIKRNITAWLGCQLCFILLVALGMWLLSFVQYSLPIFIPLSLLYNTVIFALFDVILALFYDHYYEQPLEELALAQRELGF